MRNGANVFLTIGVFVALQAIFPIASLATDGGESKKSAEQAGENRWVPSLAITGGVTIQKQEGIVNSVLFEDGSTSPVPLRGLIDGDDVAVSPFVGGALELMAPALPIPTRPRLFVSAAILPTFAKDRDLALEGDPGCISGPEADAPCLSDEGGPRTRPIGEDALNGQGSNTSAEVDTVVFSASLGVAFPIPVGRRQLRIKPSIGWINYGVDAEGVVVDGTCEPVIQCTDVFGSPPGFLRETILTGSDSQRFNGIGPGLDVEVDVGHYGPLGVSLFTGFRAYAIVGDRTISFSASETFTDQISDPGVIPPVRTDEAVARFEVEVDPWLYRGHVGIRFHWLGYEE